MTAEVFAGALRIESPWSVAQVDFDQGRKLLTIHSDFTPGSRFVVAGIDGAHPVHDTLTKTCRHLNFFQHECHLLVRVPRVTLPDGSVRQVEPPFAGRLKGFTLLFEVLAQQMPFAAVARIVGESAYRVQGVCEKYVEWALEAADFSTVKALAIDETSRARGHDYITLAAEVEARRVLFVTEGRDAAAILELAADLEAHGCAPERIESVSIDMSPAFIKGVTRYLPEAKITFDKFHVIAHASQAVDQMRRIEQRSDPSLKGLRCLLLKDRSRLSAEAAAASRGCHCAPDDGAHGACVGLQGTAARDPRAQADQRGARDTHALVHLCDALEGRADEGGRRQGAQSPGGHRGVGADETDQRVSRSDQRVVPSGEAPRTRVHAHVHDQDRDLPDRRQAELQHRQSACRPTHLEFNRARNPDPH